MIEADYSSITERGSYLEEAGFQLIDIIDRVMYGEVLWQCDLVYLRKGLPRVWLTGLFSFLRPRLRPPMFDRKYWKPLP